MNLRLIAPGLALAVLGSAACGGVSERKFHQPASNGTGGMPAGESSDARAAADTETLPGASNASMDTGGAAGDEGTRAAPDTHPDTNANGDTGVAASAGGATGEPSGAACTQGIWDDTNWDEACWQ